MMIALVLCTAVLLLSCYKRYIPVFDIPCSEIKSESKEATKVIVDIRDYNISYKEPIEGAINIPVAYLKRYSLEIMDKDVHVFASDRVEKNIGIRVLRKNGIKVTSYSITNCSRKEKFSKTA